MVAFYREILSGPGGILREEEKIKMNTSVLSLESVLEFEIAAYRAETQLAHEKHRAELISQSILNSRSWRYTRLPRLIVTLMIRPMTRSPNGVRGLQWLNRILP